MKKTTLLIFITLVNIVFSQSIPLQNLKLWLRSDTCVIKDASNNISAWKDVSGNNNNLFAYSGEEPLFIPPSNDLNNLPAVSVSNIKGFTFNTVFLIDSFSVFYVGKKNSVSDILSILGDSAKYTGLYNWNDGNYYLQEASTFVAIPNNNGADYSAYCFTFNKSNVTAYKDGVLTGQSNYNYTGNFSFNQLGRSEFYGSFPANGEICEIIIYNSVLNQTNRNFVLNYLSNKYASPVNLGPDIVISNTFCDTILSSSSRQENYLWSNGLTTPTISVNQSGKYWLRSTDIFGRISSDTILVNYPTINIPVKNSFCTNDTLTWDTGLPKSFFTFLWQNSSNDSLQKIYQIGTYSVYINDAFGCSISSNSINVTEDTYPITATLGGDTTMCAGNFISLKSGAEQTLSYIWNDSSTNPSLAIDTTGQYSAILTNTNNCVARDTIHVNISGQAPTANFSNSIGCLNSLVLFSNSSAPPSGNTIDSTFWSFGDLSATNTSTLVNPSHSYASVGSYSVSLKVKTNAGCEQTIVKTITIAPVPTATFAIGTSCQNDSTSFLNQSTGITGYSITNSYWNFGDASPSATTSIISPKHVYNNSAIYTVKLLVINSAGCKDSIYKTVSVNAEVKADFTYNSACTNSPTNFTSISTIPPAPYQPTYLWNFGVGTGTANVANPIKTYTNSGVYNVTLLVDGTNGCTSNITKLINVYLPPVTSFSIPAFCAKDTVNAINLSNPQSGILSSFNWKLNNTSFSALQSPTLSLTNPGNYSIRLTTINSFGCKDSTTTSLTIFPLPVVDYTTSPTAFYYINEPINFTPSIGNANSYLWNMNGNSTYTIQSPTEMFNTEGSYNVSLSLKDQNGCKGSKTKNIFVSKRYLDLAVLNVNTIKDNDGFMTVVADIANYGSVPINSFKMAYQISDGGSIKETWNGTLNPNSFYTFTFNATSASTQNSTNNITCVEIEKINTILDDNITNNSLCNSLNNDNIDVANPLPNPTNRDIILPITLNRDLDYTIAIYNSIGQTQYEETTKKGIEGLNFVSLNTSSYAHGCYIIKIIIGEEVFIKKFIKTNYE